MQITFRTFSIVSLLLSLFLMGCSEEDQLLRYSFEGSEKDFSKVADGPYDETHEAAITEIFQKYLNEDSLFDYKALKDNAQDSADLQQVLGSMGITDVTTFTDDEKKAFYINAYNVATIELIVSNYEKTLGSRGRSIKNIDSLGNAVWDRFKFTIGKASLSLNDIEKGILIPMGDARIHFAVNCASIGCPPLRNEAYAADVLEAQLDEMSDLFVNDGTQTEFDIDNKTIRTSKIMRWYARDFDISYGSVSEFFKSYVSTDILPDKNEIDEFRVRYTKYDWGLNEGERK